MFGTPDQSFVALSGAVRISTIILMRINASKRYQGKGACIGCMGWQILARMTLVRIISLLGPSFQAIGATASGASEKGSSMLATLRSIMCTDLKRRVGTGH